MISHPSQVYPFVIKMFDDITPNINQAIQELHRQGGRVCLVGGTVRDVLCGIKTTDLDFEVYGLECDVLENILNRFFVVRLVGKSFGVLRTDNFNIDWSLPRRDSSGRKPEVAIDPFLDEKTAFSRRDFTMNSMGVNLKTGQFIDYFNGYEDLQKGILKATDNSFFIQDPLRFYRVFFMLGRYASITDPQLDALCASLDLKEISFERIEIEFHKWIDRSTMPSRPLIWLERIGKLKEIFPELAAARLVNQDPEWHPEGDVLAHLLQTVDCAAMQQTYATIEERRIVVYAALFHDIGKNVTTKFIDGRLRAHGHAQAGAHMVVTCLKRFTRNEHFIETVRRLVFYHMHPVHFIRNNAPSASYKKLAMHLHPYASIEVLSYLLQADHNGRKDKNGCLPEIGPNVVKEFCLNARAAKVWSAPENPLIKADRLLKDHLPGPHIGLLLRAAYLYQIERDIKDPDVVYDFLKRHPAWKKSKNGNSSEK